MKQRQIKFRAWDEKNKHWKYWDIGELFAGNALSWFAVLDHRTRGQFTGLLDKNGKEIYEGDVIEYMRSGKKARRAVEWIDMHSGYPMLTTNPLDIEIIGNIYENPELIKP